jgi:hypothetical protein
MTILFAITAAIIGALFWVGRRRYYYPVIVSDNTSETDVIAGDVDAIAMTAATSRELWRLRQQFGRRQRSRRLSGPCASDRP